MFGKLKVLSFCFAALVSNRAQAAADIYCESGSYSKTYLIIDQSVSYPRDVEEKTKVVVANESGSEVFKTAKLEWVSAGDSESALIPLVNQKSAGHLTVGYTQSWTNFPPKNCLRCSPETLRTVWSAVLTLNGQQTVFSCSTATF